MTQSELITALAQCKTFKKDLTPMTLLMERLGDPQNGLKFVHVAGTNGKGSTTTMLSAVLRQAGYRTGTFVSPYILEFRERIQCNGEMIPEADLCAIGERVITVVRQLEAEGIYPAEFDAVTAIALLWFAQMQCDIVVLEVGMGGGIDSTNIIPTETVAAAAVTSISLDHTAILGDTEAAIAKEKAGILKPEISVVFSGSIGAEAMTVLQDTAAACSCLVTIAHEESVTIAESRPDGLELVWQNLEFSLPLPGLYQRQNAATALAVIIVLRSGGWQISDEAICSGMAQARFPARMELLGRAPLFWLDGAHNPEGVAALRPMVAQMAVSGKKICINGMMADKNCTAAVAELAPVFDGAVTLQPQNPRAMTAADLAALWMENGTPAQPADSIQGALETAIDLAGEDGAVICCGSLYLCAEMRPVVMAYFQKYN